MIEDNGSKNNSKSKGKSSADFSSEVDIPDIMKDIKAAVLDEAEERSVVGLSKTERQSFLLTKEMRVDKNKAEQFTLNVGLAELRVIVREIVTEELKKLK